MSDTPTPGHAHSTHAVVRCQARRDWTGAEAPCPTHGDNVLHPLSREAKAVSLTESRSQGSEVPLRPRLGCRLPIQIRGSSAVIDTSRTSNRLEIPLCNPRNALLPRTPRTGVPTFSLHQGAGTNVVRWSASTANLCCISISYD